MTGQRILRFASLNRQEKSEGYWVGRLRVGFEIGLKRRGDLRSWVSAGSGDPRRAESVSAGRETRTEHGVSWETRLVPRTGVDLSDGCHQQLLSGIVVLNQIVPSGERSWRLGSI